MTDMTGFHNFAAGYLNEDWPEEYGTDERALDAFIAENPGSVASTADEIAGVLRRTTADADLESFVDRNGASFIATVDFASYRDWLQHVESRLRASLLDEITSPTEGTPDR